MIGINQTRWTRLYNNKNYTQPEAQPIKSKELRVKKIVMIACDSIKWNTEKKKWVCRRNAQNKMIFSVLNPK